MNGSPPMPAMLMPATHSYFAIYTMERARGHSAKKRGLNWDLHATAMDRALAISHARMLALQPGVSEVHVKQVIEDTTSGRVSVRNIKRCRHGQESRASLKTVMLLSFGAIIAATLLL